MRVGRSRLEKAGIALTALAWAAFGIPALVSLFLPWPLECYDFVFDVTLAWGAGYALMALSGVCGLALASRKRFVPIAATATLFVIVFGLYGIRTWFPLFGIGHGPGLGACPLELGPSPSNLELSKTPLTKETMKNFGQQNTY